MKEQTVSVLPPGAVVDEYPRLPMMAGSAERLLERA